MPLTREDVVNAALEVLDEIGLDRLTIRKLATRLGVQAGAIYWHITNKRDLLKAMADRISCEMRDRPLPDGEWKTQVIAFAELAREVMLGRRDGARLLMTALPTVSMIASVNRLFTLLVDAGATDEQGLFVMDTIMSYVTGFVLQEQSQQETARIDGVGTEVYPPEAQRFIDAVAAYSRKGKFTIQLEMMINGLQASLPVPG